MQLLKECSREKYCARFLVQKEFAMTSVSEPTGRAHTFDDMDVAKRINIQRFRWLGHVVRMDEVVPPRRVFDAVVGERDDRVAVGKTRLKRL